MPIPSRSRQISYRLYTMDRDGHIVDVRPFEAAGDLAAMVAADTGSGEVLELWCGDRRVTEFPTLQASSGGSMVYSIEAAVDRRGWGTPEPGAR